MWQFDHVVSPRQLVDLPQITGIGAPFLTFYYLGALNIGYFLGYLLLLSGKEEARQWRKPSELGKALNRGLHIRAADRCPSGHRNAGMAEFRNRRRQQQKRRGRYLRKMAGRQFAGRESHPLY